MARCFWIFNGGCATASIQPRQEYGSPLNQASRGSTLRESWMPWRCIAKCRASSSRATPLSIYPSWNTRGLFNETDFFMGPGPPARGVDMVRNTCCAFVGAELSNALAAWSHDAKETSFKDRTCVLGLLRNHLGSAPWNSGGSGCRECALNPHSR